MGEFFSKKKTKKASKKQQILSILAMGNSMVGKTALIEYLEKQKTENTLTTIGSHYTLVEKKVKKNNGEEVLAKIKVWDSPGQERFEEIVLSAVKNTQGIFLVFDITYKESFDDLQKWLKKVEDAKDINTFPFVIMANKIDLEDRRAVSKEEAKQFADKYHITLFETSAKSGVGVEDAFQYLIQKVYDTNQDKKNNNFMIE